MNRLTFEARIERTREVMKAARLSALFVAPSSDLEYLIGEPRPVPMPTSYAWPLGWLAGAWVVHDREPLLTVPRMAADYEWVNAAGWPMRVIDDDAKASQMLRQLVADLGLTGKSVGLSEKALARLALEIRDCGADLDIVAAPTLVPMVRARKDAAEVEILREACTITDTAFREVVKRIRPGVTERDLVDEIRHQLAILGSGPAYPIGAWGWGATYPRSGWDRRPMDVPIGAPNLIAFDFGASWKGYCTDFCRVVHLAEPGKDYRRIHDAVVETQSYVVSQLKPDGKTAEDVYQIGMSRLRDAGLDRYFPDRLGHGIGMDVHEIPSLFLRDMTPIETGMVVAVEPQVFDGYRYAGVEDLVLVGSDGGERLNGYTRDVVIAG